MAVTDEQFRMLLDLVKETRDDVKAIRENYAKASDLKACRNHCDVTTVDFDDRIRDIERHKDCACGAQKEREERRQLEDLEAQKGMKVNILVGAVFTGVTALLATIGGYLIARYWP